MIKKIILNIVLMIAGLLQAQVIISEQANPTPTNSSVLLEFGTQPKGIILPSVPEATDAVAGTFIVNTTDKAVQYFDGTNWINLTYPDELVENPYTNSGATDLADGIIIGAQTSDKPGVLVLESTTQAMVLPKVADPHLNILSPVAGTIVYDITSDALAVYDGKEWSYWAASLNPAGILPSNITLSQNRKHFIASVYDTDYLPYTAPTGPATINVVNANGSPDLTVDYQGIISTTGITVHIPVASVTGTGTVQAWTSTFVVPAMYAEDGQSRTLELSWGVQDFTATSKYITATIKSLGGDFLAKKLDINAGIGDNYLGVLLGAFQYPYNNAGTLTSYEVRDIPGIPDKMFGKTDNVAAAGQRHNFLYLPVQGDNDNIWLNNNLGADYSKIGHPSFNLTQQATSATDYRAYGSLFQWGRKPDGHELINWTGATTGTAVNTAVTKTISANPTHTMLIYSYWTCSGCTSAPNPLYNWRPDNDATLWQSEGSTNNPCPSGFRVPDESDFTSASSSTLTALKLPSPGHRDGLGYTNDTCCNPLEGDPAGPIRYAGYAPWYATSTATGTSYAGRVFTVRISNAFGAAPSASKNDNQTKVDGHPVRCIKD